MTTQTREQAIRKAIAETPDGEELREQALQLVLENTRLCRMLKQSVESVGECAGTVEISFDGKGKTRKMMLTACCSGDDKALADAFVKAWSDRDGPPEEYMRAAATWWRSVRAARRAIREYRGETPRTQGAWDAWRAHSAESDTAQCAMREMLRLIEVWP